jgi:hypothetical protein
MADKTIPIEDISKLEIPSIGGDLYLNGWNRDEIRIRDFSDQDILKKNKTKLELSFTGDGLISIPHQLSLMVKLVGGDGVIKGLGSSLKITSVGGDLTLSDINKATVESVGGDVFAKRIQGDLQIKQVGNDCQVDNLKGQLSIEQIGNDVQIQEISGGISVQAAGDGQINFSPVPWQAYQISVLGDLSVGLPDDCNAELSLQSDNDEIIIKVGSIDEIIDQFEYQKVLGEGGAVVMLSAGGKLYVSSDKYSWFSGFQLNSKEIKDLAADFSNQTTGQIKNHLGNLEVDLRESLAGLSEKLDTLNLPKETLKELKNQVEDTSHLAVQKAEAAAVKAAAKIEKNLVKIQKEAHRLKRKSSEFDLGEFLSSQAQKREVSEKERLMILEMLQEKRISLEEADELLKALEGKG